MTARVFGLLLLFLAVSPAAATETYGLPPLDADLVADDEREVLDTIVPQAPEFRFVAPPEPLPGQTGATIPITLDLADAEGFAADGPPAMAALHGRDGSPLDACAMPCTLKVHARQPVVLVLYRYGSLPQLRPPFEFSAAGRMLIQPTRLEVDFGYNAVDALADRARCRAETEVRVASGADGDSEPCVRYPPHMPPLAERSGHCRVGFSVLSDGTVRDVEAYACTDLVFCNPSARAASRWHYYPAIRAGKVADHADLETKISFRLSDEAGRLIPEPTGELLPCIGIA